MILWQNLHNTLGLALAFSTLRKTSLRGDFQGLLGQEIWRMLQHLPQDILQDAAVMVVGNFLWRIRTRDNREGL